MRERFRVLQVSARFPPDVGGVETHVAEVAPRLRGLGFDVRVLTTDRAASQPWSAEVQGVPVTRVPAYPRSRDYYLAPAIVREIRNSGADLVHLQGYHTLVAPLAMAAALQMRIPYVVSFHSGGHPSALRQGLRGAQRVALRPGLRRAARLIPVSRFELELFRRSLALARERFRLVRNGATMPVPRTRRERGGAAVVSVGRLERYKGHHRLVAAWPHLLHRIPEARLRILGVGPQADPLRSLIADTGMQGRIEVGSIDAADRQSMADAVGSANLACLLSEYEAHPVSVMEALAVGTPALVSRTSGLTELVEDGLAIGLAPHASPSTIADAIARALADPPTVDPGRLPTWDGCAEQLRDLYLEVLEGTSCVS